MAIQRAAGKFVLPGYGCKRAVGIIVVGERGQRISFGQATGRYFGKILSWLTLGLLFLMVAFSENKRGLHDIMAGTFVVGRP